MWNQPARDSRCQAGPGRPVPLELGWQGLAQDPAPVQVAAWGRRGTRGSPPRRTDCGSVTRKCYFGPLPFHAGPLPGLGVRSTHPLRLRAPSPVLRAARSPGARAGKPGWPWLAELPALPLRPARPSTCLGSRLPADVLATSDHSRQLRHCPPLRPRLQGPGRPSLLPRCPAVPSAPHQLCRFRCSVALSPPPVLKGQCWPQAPCDSGWRGTQIKPHVTRSHQTEEKAEAQRGLPGQHGHRILRPHPGPPVPCHRHISMPQGQACPGCGATSPGHHWGQPRSGAGSQGHGNEDDVSQGDAGAPGTRLHLSTLVQEPSIPH